ncbi:MAG: hypothetical protein HY674_13485 [Chloroflexi bacterium]|nr:hypothetical protein [Chloroflexota bacterium]
MNPPVDMLADLQGHLEVCRGILAVTERENQALRNPAPPPWEEICAAKKNLLPRLNQALDQLRKHRVNWQKLSATERSRHAEIGALLRQNQDVIMKIIVLDRENEQALLRRGLVPLNDLPPVNRQRPHYVADLYRRQSAR